MEHSNPLTKAQRQRIRRQFLRSNSLTPVKEKARIIKRRRIFRQEHTLARNQDESIVSFQETYKCIVCWNVLYRPVKLNPCGHILCEFCLHIYLKTGLRNGEITTFTCPLCRQLILTLPTPCHELWRSILTAAARWWSKEHIRTHVRVNKKHWNRHVAKSERSINWESILRWNWTEKLTDEYKRAHVPPFDSSTFWIPEGQIHGKVMKLVSYYIGVKDAKVPNLDTDLEPNFCNAMIDPEYYKKYKDPTFEVLSASEMFEVGPESGRHSPEGSESLSVPEGSESLSAQQPTSLSTLAAFALHDRGRTREATADELSTVNTSNRTWSNLSHDNRYLTIITRITSAFVFVEILVMETPTDGILTGMLRQAIHNVYIQCDRTEVPNANFYVTVIANSLRQSLLEAQLVEVERHFRTIFDNAQIVTILSSSQRDGVVRMPVSGGSITTGQSGNGVARLPRTRTFQELMSDESDDLPELESESPDSVESSNTVTSQNSTNRTVRRIMSDVLSATPRGEALTSELFTTNEERELMRNIANLRITSLPNLDNTTLSNDELIAAGNNARTELEAIGNATERLEALSSSLEEDLAVLRRSYQRNNQEEDLAVLRRNYLRNNQSSYLDDLD
jgi:RING-type zinc-finger